MTETLDQQTPTANRLTTRSTSFVPPTFSKVSPEHLRLNAALYVRQSTSQQLRDHQESTHRQYQLTHRLEAFGWHRDQIIVIDEDLGISGSGRQQRPGFQRLFESCHRAESRYRARTGNESSGTQLKGLARPV